MQEENTAEIINGAQRRPHIEQTGGLSNTSRFAGNVQRLTSVESHEQQITLGHTRVNPAMRVIEISVAVLVLTITLPVQLVLAFIIWRGTPGPVLFRQQRVGMGARNFTFVKFRTLYADARKRYPELYAYQYTEEELETLKFKVEYDPRVTRQGVWMRKTSLDELPNFWNLLTGDMALVGPRPEIPEMLPYYKGETIRKFSVRPGITGLAQISGRGRLSFKKTVALDLEYVNNRSFWLDIKILGKTFIMVILHYGAF